MGLAHSVLSSGAVKAMTVTLAAWLAYEGWLGWTAHARVDPVLIDKAEKSDRVAAVIKLSFEPERFHVLKIQEWGRIRRVRGKEIELRAISAEGIRHLASRYYWIDRIEPIEREP